jgi:ferritin-like metal-binding protein YciE
MKTLKDLFLGELADMYDAEHRLIKELPKMARAATCEKLKQAILAHLTETQGHVTKLQQVFQSFDAKAKGKTCEATKGLVKEGDEIAAEFKASPAINAALISAAQKVEHYEIASYGCLLEWAVLLGNTKAGGLIEEILAQEKAANEKLTELARAGSNEEALDNSGEDGSEDASGERSGNVRRSVRATGARRNRIGSVISR